MAQGRANNDIEPPSAGNSPLEMALRHIHSLPIAETDSLKGFAGAVRAHCYQALERVSTEQTPVSPNTAIEKDNPERE